MTFRWLTSREAILRTAKTLVEDTKNLVSSAQASQDVLATAAQSAVGSVSKLADNVKLGALALGPDDSDAQVKISSIKMRKTPSSLYSVAVHFSVISFGVFWFTTDSKRIIHFQCAKVNYCLKKTHAEKESCETLLRPSYYLMEILPH